MNAITGEVGGGTRMSDLVRTPPPSLRLGFSRPLGAAKSNFTAYGCDVDSLSESGTKTPAGQH